MKKQGVSKLIFTDVFYGEVSSLVITKSAAHTFLPRHSFVLPYFLSCCLLI